VTTAGTFYETINFERFLKTAHAETLLKIKHGADRLVIE